MGTSENPIKYQRTGLAIIVSLALVFCFFLLYMQLFGFIVSIYADYDPSFGTGFGALILLVLAPNVLSFLSAAVVSKQFFPHANRVVLFYGLTIILVLMFLGVVVGELQRQDTDSFTLSVILLIDAAILVVTVFSMKLVLVPKA